MGRGCLWLRGSCCLAAGLRDVKPIPNMFSFGEKAYVAGKDFVCTCPSHPPLASSERTPQCQFHQWHKTRFGKLHSPNLNCARGTNLSPSASFSGKQRLPSSHLALCNPQGQGCSGCLWLRDPCYMAGGLRGLIPNPTVLYCGDKADVAGKGLVCTGPSNPPLSSSGEIP